MRNKESPKEKRFKKGIAKRLFSVVLALAMVVALMPMNSTTVLAAAPAGQDYSECA